ncbi:MAG: amidohydrolase family protein [Sphingomonas sp.]
MAAHKNVHHKYSTFLLELLRRGGVPDREFLNYVIGVYGTANIVWGSDFGNTPGDLAAFAKRALDSAANLTLAQKRAIFYGNAKRLFVSGGPRRARAALMSGTHRRRGSGTRERG